MVNVDTSWSCISFIMHGHTLDIIEQGWPDFFSQGPFSIALTVLGAASSLKERNMTKCRTQFSLLKSGIWIIAI